jgi:primase-polymerase (primpol)-like protein
MDKAMETGADTSRQAEDINSDGKIASRITQRAMEILEREDPVDFIIKSFERMHIGDKPTAKYLLASVISQQIKNTKGIQPKTHGRSTGGKTHCAEVMAHHMPQGVVKEMTVSAKALYYEEDLKARTVIFSDDVSMTDDLDATLKRTMSNFTKITIHKTVDKGVAVTKEIPPRIVWWLTSVGDSFSEELNNRLVGLGVDDDPETDRLVFEHQKRQAKIGQLDLIEDETVQICREIIRLIREEELFNVIIPFSESIEMSHIENRRNFP